MAPVLDPTSLAVGTSALGDHHLVPRGGLRQPPPPISARSASLLLASPIEGQAAILGCFCWLQAAAMQEGETCSPLIWLQLQNLHQAVGLSLLAIRRGGAGGSQRCLLIRTRRSLAAEEGWEPSTSSQDSPQLPPAPAKAPVLPSQKDGDGVGAHERPPATACRGDGALLFAEKSTSLTS